MNGKDCVAQPPARERCPSDQIPHFVTAGNYDQT